MGQGEALPLATQGLHQEHEAPYTHRSKDGEEDDGEPEGCLGDEAGQFVHEVFFTVKLWGKDTSSEPKRV